VPYILATYRKPIDERLDPLIEYLDNDPPTALDGDVNYVVTRLLHALYPPSYFNYNRAVGVLECIKQELYRRRIGPYEDTKIVVNGDVE
jgi:hypothetical protein